MPIQPQLPAAPINTPWIDASTGSVSWQWRQWMNQFQQGMGYDSSAVAFGPDAQSQNDGVAIGVGSDTGSGTGNVVIGAGASALTGNNNTVVGTSALSSPGSDNVLIGKSTSASGSSQIAIGSGATCGSGLNDTVIGYNASAPGSPANNTAIGASSVAGGPSATAVGAGAVSGEASVAVGRATTTGAGTDNTVVGYSASSTGGTNFNVAIGSQATATGGDSTSVGYSNSVSGARSTAIGRGNTITHTDVIVIGKGFTSTANGQVLIGTASTVVNDIWFGRGVTHTGAASTVVIHATDGTGSDVAGDDLILAGGAPTGSGVGGNLIIKTAAAGLTGTTLRTLTERFRIADDGKIDIASTVRKYVGVTTAGYGLHAIYGSGRSAAQTAAVTSVAVYTNIAVDGTFIVSANINVTASTTHSIQATVTYVDEGGTTRTSVLNFSQVTGTLLNAITNVQGIGAYEGIPLHIRVKASSSITIATTGTFTSVTYNVEGYITQIG